MSFWKFDRDTDAQIVFPWSSWGLAIARFLVPEEKIVHKFGFAEVSTTYVPITVDLTYQTPMAPVSLEAVSDNAADAVGGLGATKINVQGIGPDWREQNETVSLTGITPVQLLKQFLRVFRIQIIESGTYAGPTAASHAGKITVRTTGAGAIWGSITDTPLPSGQSQIGTYTIPKGYTGYLLDKDITVASNKSIDLYFFTRENADDVTPPYIGIRRLVEREVGVAGHLEITDIVPKGPWVGPCDVGFLGKVVSGTASMSVEFEILLVENGD